MGVLIIVEYEIDINFNLNNTEQLDDAANKLEELKENAENTGTSTENMGEQAQHTSDEVKEMGDSASSSAGQIDLLGDAISGIASLGLAAEFNSTAMAADKYNVSMAALNQVAGNNNVSMSKVSDSINKVTSATSIGGGQARSYFSMLMNLGVTNTNALADSMIALKGQSAITGGSMEQMSSKMTSIINMSSLSARSLTGLGISLQQLATTNNMSVEEMKSAWSTMTADQKLEALNNAMARNSSLVTTMNQTTSEQLQEVKNSWAALEITVGQSSTVASQAVLGFANGALQTLNNAVKNIPFAATFASGALAVGSLVTGVKPALDTFNSLSMTVRNSLDIISGLGSVIGTASKMITAMSSAESISAGIKAAWAVATGTETAAEAASIPVKTADTAATTALGVATNFLLSPIVLVTIAIIALIAGLWYLYNTNETVRNCINAVIGVFRTLASLVVGAVTSAFNTVRGAIDNVKNSLSPLSSGLDRVKSAFNSVKSTVSGVIDTLNSYISKAREALSIDTSGFSGASYAGVGFEGFDSTLNHTLSNDLSNSRNKSTGDTIFNINGIIEETASEYIVKSVNDRLRRENLIRGA